MSLAFTSIVPTRNGGWIFTWLDTGIQPYRAVLNGVLLANVSDVTYTFTGNGYAKFPPPLEIVSKGQQALSEIYSCHTIFQWYGEPEVAAQYLVQQSKDNGTSWQTIKTFQELGQWVYSYTSPVEADENTYLFRVIAVDSVGNQSFPRHYQSYVVCPPVSPDGTFTVGYGSGKINIMPV